jgi:hypothetical protein
MIMDSSFVISLSPEFYDGNGVTQRVAALPRSKQRAGRPAVDRLAAANAV